ncbi:hypothetical protein [Halorubrum sp. AS12]|uniref:hypothetical protein n=1 Tax=Halorubrum sp. AS12 TaxID=3409687 RepID=UPI003DA79E46
MNSDVISIVVISLTPATIITYNLLSMSGYLTPEDARQVKQDWKQGVGQRELNPDNPSFDTILSIISEHTDNERPEGIEYLILAESGFGGGGVWADFGDERDRENLAPLTLTDKWVNDYIKRREDDIKIWFYRVALGFLSFGLVLEILNRSHFTL